MAIIQRGKNKFTIEIHLGKDANGKQKRYTETLHTSKKSEVKARESELKAKYKKGDLTQIRKISFQEFTNIFLDEYAEQELQPKTVHRYKELLSKLIIPSLGFIRLDKLLSTDILMFENDLRKDGARLDGKPGGLSEKTILHHHKLIKLILEKAVKWGYIQNNPSNKVDPPKIRNSEIYLCIMYLMYGWKITIREIRG
jgi:integrase